MKSSEDMLVAAQYIGERVNYNRAIEIYSSSLQLDPDNEELKSALAFAESMRYMSADRFSQAREGMTEDEVTAAIGEVKPGNIKDYADVGKDDVAWFYPREGGGSAAVWFRPEGGELRVQLLKFDQVEPKSTD